MSSTSTESAQEVWTKCSITHRDLDTVATSILGQQSWEQSFNLKYDLPSRATKLFLDIDANQYLQFFLDRFPSIGPLSITFFGQFFNVCFCFVLF